MAHQEIFRWFDGGPVVAWQRETRQLNMPFAADASPRVIGEQILRELKIAGSFRAQRSQDGRTLLIARSGAFSPRRLTYTFATGTVVVETQEFRVQSFLENLHRRRGFTGESLANDLWAASLDVLVVSILFWIFSGLWMWWQLKVTRRVGAACALAGMALFGLLIANL